jgi:4-hydroxybenzoyl-CoA thioesterase
VTVISRIPITVEWGDCDPADIVFYPNYMKWFDAGSHRLFRDVGADPLELARQYGIVGLPLVHASADFRAPSRFGDELIVESRIGVWHRKTFEVHHRVLGSSGDLRVEGREIRIWGERHPEDPGRLRAGDVPDAVRSLFRSTPQRTGT